MGRIWSSTIRRILYLLITLYIFLIGIKLIETSFRLFGSGFAEQAITVTSNPVVGLFIGILATSIMQSSSATTSILVGLVAGGGISVSNAIPIIMGANIGTTVTNIIVSLAHIRRREEFRLAFAGATVHDFFNIIAVLVLLPLEYFTHFLENSATFLADAFFGAGSMQFVSPLKIITVPVIDAIKNLASESAVLILLLGGIALFVSLRYLVNIMKSLVMTKMEVFVDRYLFKTALTGFAVGLLFTAVVQSSSVTTSIAVPLVGSGLLTIEKIFPYVLGANLGTTVTAILASLVTSSKAAVIVAFVHMLFNFIAILFIYPFRRIPITMAKKFACFASKHKWVTILYLAVAFYVIPLILIWFVR